LIFINPTTHIRQAPVNHPIPNPIDIAALRARLHSPDPACALTAALLGFHAVRVKDLRAIKLTDIHDRRLHLADRTVVLAPAVVDRLDTYLESRSATWPHTSNPHLFINVRSATHTRAVNQHWHTMQLGMPAQSIRQDRILDEAFATGGDLRQISELFGLSVSQANIYANHAHASRIADRADS
jgi:site-specific recombinase XerD